MHHSDVLILITSTSSELITRQTEEEANGPGSFEAEALNRISLKDLDSLADTLIEWQSAKPQSNRGFNDLAVVLISDDEFPRWPAVDYARLSTLTDKPVLLVKARPNLRAAWTAFANGAVAASADGSTICSITMQEETTDVAICRSGEIIDTASMSIGPQCLLFSPDLQVTQISDTGETFLDAVAKKIKAADLVEESMVDLIGALIGEAIANLICRKKAPQVTQRLLASDPLKHDYQIDRIFLSGHILDYARQPQVDPRTHGHLGGYLAQNVLASFSERQRTIELVDCLALKDTMWRGKSKPYFLRDLSAHKSGNIDYDLDNAAVLAMPNNLQSPDRKRFLANRIEERIRRFHIEPGAPILVSLNLDSDEDECASNMQAIDRVVTARQAVDATMFLKKPRDFVVIATTEKMDEQSATAQARRLAAETANKNIPVRIVFVESPWKPVGEDYISWQATHIQGSHQDNNRISAVLHHLLLTARLSQPGEACPSRPS